MKMGTIRSPCPYDAAVRHAPQSVNLRRPAILRYASWAAVEPDDTALGRKLGDQFGVPIGHRRPIVTAPLAIGVVLLARTYL
jgi:hypothetical protein